MRIVINSDTITKPYKELGEDLEGIFDYGLGEAAKSYAEYVKSNYLQGQALEYRTGQTYKSVKFVRTKRKPSLSYTVLPGVGINGHLNYLNRYIGTEKEFMAPSYKSWKATKEYIKLIENNFEKVCRKKGLL